MGHSMEEITAEQERSADFFTGLYYAVRQCFLITVLLHKN